ncbi:MAG: MATE family efflux transporter [Clostridiales bacterium]|nr:MATE family efflux transporter [Bacillota bacterium]MEE0516492.1 MATE family efflux transporter [Anaerovoracaceae bacterium]PWL93987.1 MAG: MATE family efflux transporter [Clostridiales bacterium]
MSDNLIYNKEINMKNMLTFTIPTMVRMVFVSMYSIVDGIVVSNFVGSLGLSAINIVYPVLNVCMALAFMLAAGSNAIMGKKMGEGKVHEANSFMSLTVIVNVAAIIVFTAIFLMWDEKIYMMLGSDEELLPYCMEYGRIIVLGGPVWVMQVLFQSYLVTADKPHMGLWLSVAAGVTNIVLDVIFVGAFRMGMAGAAMASVAGMMIGGLVPLTVFFNKKSLIHFEKPVWEGREFLKALGNGSSEMVSNLASAVTTTLFNLQMMALIGEKGVAAISAILYLQFIFLAVFFGFVSGISPVVSYNYGAGNKTNIHRTFKISMKIVIIFSLSMFALAEVFTGGLVLVFASKDAVLSELMISGFRIIAVSILFSGLNIFASGFFTALNNGRVSALISILRTFVLEAGALILLPEFMGIDGVWWSLPAAEILSAVIAVVMIVKYRKTYGY